MMPWRDVPDGSLMWFEDGNVAPVRVFRDTPTLMIQPYGYQHRVSVNPDHQWPIVQPTDSEWAREVGAAVVTLIKAGFIVTPVT